MSTGEDRNQSPSRLLRHLSEPDAYGVESPLGCGRIALYRRGAGGATLGAGYVEAAEAEALVAAGFAGWISEAGKRRLRLAGAQPGKSRATTTVMVDGEAQQVALDERESPLLWLHRRPGKDGQPQIAAAEFAAGERFRADLTLAQMLPRVTVNWDAGLAAGTHAAARGPAEASDSCLAARQRVRLACKRLGPELSGLAIDVCGFLKGLDQVERERKWPARSAKVVLRLALAALVEHYGLGGKEERTASHAWRARDARPTIPAPPEPRD
ncbi:DUF6456 domain-containing protein [Bosea sp. (in: a-proteobacteria)]|uniref:DUF6456 domain-containing protein n=1 Tax=Bosea sp. (in: a-proteobacteria) TaxID=1871050 RepID=UPI0025BE827A|nr:DUF6456 domain-containing protein [Bosea sp. (in: a-proteobacteria)]MBR3194081.1 ATPase [Bosea sp. (in: a-proteobacteria)]